MKLDIPVTGRNPLSKRLKAILHHYRSIIVGAELLETVWCIGAVSTTLLLKDQRRQPGHVVAPCISSCGFLRSFHGHSR
jgi:hypothetical protein